LTLAALFANLWPVKKGLVLVVDDERDFRAIARHLLERAGYEVVEADCGEAALKAFAARSPALILLDGNMPDMDGFEVLRRLRADPAGKSVPVLMCTVRSTISSVSQGLEAGATDYILKPFSMEELLERVGRALEGGRGK